MTAEIIDSDIKPKHLKESANTRYPVTVVVPAHNEGDQIALTLESLLDQGLGADDEIIVISDNSSDDTVKIAQTYPVTVMETIGNKAKKAGALNQVLVEILKSDRPDTDFLMVMDADTVLCDNFILLAMAYFRPEMGAVCGSYGARPTPGLLPLLQSMEYVAEKRRVMRRGGIVHVLSGTATLVPLGVLRQVQAVRGIAFPGRPGEVYSTLSITEDYELTLAIQILGYVPASSDHMFTVTDVMTTWHDLINQRVRWQRGTVETLMVYGLSKVTWKPWVRQVAIYALSLLPLFLVVLYGMSYDRYGVRGIFTVTPWLLFTPFVIVSQLVCGWKAGGKARLLTLCIIPNLIYETIRSVIYWYALFLVFRGGENEWIEN